MIQEMKSRYKLRNAKMELVIAKSSPFEANDRDVKLVEDAMIDGGHKVLNSIIEFGFFENS